MKLPILIKEKFMCDYFVYGHFLGSDCYYVGCGNKERPYNSSSRKDIWKAIFSSIKPLVIILSKHRTKKSAYKEEQRTIKAFRKCKHPLINEENYSYWEGKTVSEEHKRKIGEASKNTPRTLAWNEAISKAKKGKSNGLEGREMPLNHRQKISEARLNSDKVKASAYKVWETRRKNGTANNFTTSKAKAVVCMESGKRFRCAKEAAKELQLSDKHIQACCVGRRKTHGGFTWRYD